MTETGSEPAKHRWSTAWNLLMLVVGGGALAWLLSSSDWQGIGSVIRGIGAWAFVILGIELGSLCCDAAAVHAFMRPEARMVSYLRVLGAYASGRAINVLTPFGALGEATKVTMLAGHAPRARVVSSLVLRNVAALYLDVAIMLLGIPITMLLVDLPHTLKIAVLAGLAVLVPLMVVIGVMIHRGAVGSTVDILRGTRLISAERARAWKTKLTEVDAHIRELHVHRTSGTRVGLMFVALSKILTTTSMVLIMIAVGVHLTPALVVGEMSVGVLIAWISSIVPLGLGLGDGGNFALYAILGSTGKLGLFVTLIARARTVAIAVLGLCGMAVMNAHGRYLQWRVHGKLERLKAERAS